MRRAVFGRLAATPRGATWIFRGRPTGRRWPLINKRKSSLGGVGPRSSGRARGDAAGRFLVIPRPTDRTKIDGRRPLRGRAHYWMVSAHGLSGAGSRRRRGALPGNSEGRRRSTAFKKTRGRARWMVWARSGRGPEHLVEISATIRGRPDEVSTSRPRRRRDPSPRNIHRPSRGVAAIRQRNIHRRGRGSPRRIRARPVGAPRRRPRTRRPTGPRKSAAPSCSRRRSFRPTPRGTRSTPPRASTSSRAKSRT